MRQPFDNEQLTDMNPPVTFIITLCISIATLFVGNGLIDRLSARKHWNRQIEECNTAISGTVDEHLQSALRRKSHHFAKAVALDKHIPISPWATMKMTIGYVGLFVLGILQFPLFHLPGLFYIAALPGVIVSTLIVVNGVTAIQITAIEQDVFEQLGYPETFHRLSTTPRRQRMRLLTISKKSTHALKQHSHELNPQPQPQPQPRPNPT